MKYWRLFTSAEKEVGSAPQIVESVFDGNYTDKNQLWNLYSKQIDHNSLIPKGRLQKRAKQTDLLSVGFGAGDLFVSDKLRRIIESFPIQGIQFADSEIYTQSGERIKSNIMHPFVTEYSFIDMTQSRFQISDVMGKHIYETPLFNSFDEFLQKKTLLISENKKYEDISVHRWLSISKLSVKESSDFGICSVFDITYGGIGFYISQQLKDIVHDTKCTGVIFRELDERYP